MSEEIIQRFREILQAREFLVVGKKVARVDALDAVLGKPMYTADLVAEQPLYVKAVRSKLPSALVKGIDLSKVEARPSVKKIITHKDIPGENDAGSLIPDRPLLAVDRVRHVGEAIALVVGETVEDAEEAADLVEVFYDPLPVVASPAEAMKPDAPRVQDRDNIVTHFKIRKGDVEKGFKQSDVIVQRMYKTQFITGLPLETEIAYAFRDGDGRITCISSMQNLHDVYNKVRGILGVPADKLRVVQAATGGGFGPKSDETPIDVAAYACLATYYTGRPSLAAFTRAEAMTVQCKRHHFEITHMVGSSRNGKLLAWKSTLIEDTGAYISKGHLVIGRATFHCTGPYEVPNVWADGYCVLTNNTMAGSTRGFGAPQAHFAAEMLMNELAEELGLSPLEIREANMLRPGSLTATSQRVEEDGLVKCYRKAVEVSGWEARMREFERFNKISRTVKKGIGIALLYHGNTLGPEGDDFATVAARVERDGTVVVQTGLTEYGTGALTSLVIVAAEALGLPVSKVQLERPDTAAIPSSGPTVASRTTAIGGNAALDAALKIRAAVASVAAKALNVKPDELDFKNGQITHPSGRSVSWEEAVHQCYENKVELKAVGYYMAPPTKWDPETGQGAPYNQYTYGALVAEVSVDMETGFVVVDRMTAAYDVGKAINPLGLVAVYEGGTIMGTGYALTEEIVHERGFVVNPNLHTFIIPTASDAPKEINSIIVEVPGPVGVFGAKAMGEIPVVLPAAAIANAVANATGVYVRELPLRPHKLLETLRKAYHP
ncbi:MAG: xanthine dehydrogenase family protein molybdopterin-binding subunit [Candidatus Caldarchaeum sp.]|nr:xanthine dehydrogenase family protein molybdopterin-binding subunit [Candidatus Caldarchaeum sp.]